jgi:hypothetical protein
VLLESTTALLGPLATVSVTVDELSLLTTSPDWFSTATRKLGSTCPAVPVSPVVVVPEPESVPELLDALEVPVDDVELDELDVLVPEELLEDEPEPDDPLLELDPQPELSESFELSELSPQRCEPPPLVVSEPNRKTRCSPVVLVELLLLIVE